MHVLLLYAIDTAPLEFTRTISDKARTINTQNSKKKNIIAIENNNLLKNIIYDSRFKHILFNFHRYSYKLLLSKCMSSVSF